LLKPQEVTLFEAAWLRIHDAQASDRVSVVLKQGHSGVRPDEGLAGDQGVSLEAWIDQRVFDDERASAANGVIAKCGSAANL